MTLAWLAKRPRPFDLIDLGMYQVRIYVLTYIYIHLFYFIYFFISDYQRHSSDSSHPFASLHENSNAKYS